MALMAMHINERHLAVDGIALREAEAFFRHSISLTAADRQERNQ
jgi:hypothetical protein